MNTLSKICAALTIAFAVFLAVLVLEIVYFFWRKRRYRSPRVTSGDVEFGSESSFHPTPSKGLLYLFCCKNLITRIEPDAETGSATASATAPALRSPPTESELDELMKQHSLYGPSRVLFTIKEEEREEIETDLSSAEREDETKKQKKTRGASLEEATVATPVIEIDDSTPFSTPCASPPYYTPSPSPPRDKISPQTSIPNNAVLHGVVKETKVGHDTHGVARFIASGGE